MKTQLLALLLLALTLNLSAAKYYVGPNGSSSNPGTDLNAPTDIYSAVAKAQGGDILFLLSGIYNLTETVRLTASGTELAPIQMLAYDAWTPFDLFDPLGNANVSTRPILKFTNQPHHPHPDFNSSRGFLHTGDYWYIKGINITDTGDSGVKLEGSYNTYELCNFWLCGDTGHQIGFTHSASDNPGLKKGAYNQIINCDSWNNWDAPDWGDADAFACKMHPGLGNEYHGCRGWNCSDDGWDMYEVQSPVVMTNCWTWKNGTEPGKSGNGNGFKVGGSGSKGNHILYRCISWGHPNGEGFDQNSNNDGVWMYNCLAFNNQKNFMMEQAGNGNNYAINCVEWGSIGMSCEFKSPYVVQNNSWQLFDGFNDAKSEAKFTNRNSHANEYEAESLTEAAFMSKRNLNGSLPFDKVAQLKETSRFRDAGTIYSVKNPSTQAEIFQYVLDGALDLGPIEYVPANPNAPTLTDASNKSQAVKVGNAIAAISFTWGGAATDVAVNGIPAEMSVVKSGKTVTISGTPAETFSYSVSTMGGDAVITHQGTITVSDQEPEPNPGDGEEPKEPAGEGKIVEEASLSVAAKGGTSMVWGPYNIKSITEATLTMRASGSSNNSTVLEYSLTNTADDWTVVGDPVRNSTTNKDQEQTINASTTPLNTNVYFRLHCTANYAATITNFIIWGEVNAPSAIEDLIEGASVVAESYFTISGVEISQIVSPGIYIKKITYDNGATETVKIIKK